MEEMEGTTSEGLRPQRRLDPDSFKKLLEDTNVKTSEDAARVLGISTYPNYKLAE